MSDVVDQFGGLSVGDSVQCAIVSMPGNKTSAVCVKKTK